MVLTPQPEVKKSGIEKSDVEDGEMEDSKVEESETEKMRRRRVIALKTVNKGEELPLFFM